MSEIEKNDKDTFLQHFEEMRPDLFLREIYERSEDAELAAESLRPSKTRSSMFSSIPMKCKGKDCPFSDTCPLFQKKIAPTGKPCPIELTLVSDFMQNIMYDLNVDPTNLVEVSMVRDLVDQEIQHVRKSKLIAKEELIQENIIGLDSENRPVIKKELHLAVELEDKILKRKKDVRNQLLASREAKAKAGQGNLDTAQVISKIFQDIRETDLMREQAVRDKLGFYQDDYIASHDSKEIIEAEIIEDE